MAIFRPTSTGHDHAFACGLTQILAEVYGCKWGAAGIPDHDGSLLFDVNGFLDFASVPLLLST